MKDASYYVSKAKQEQVEKRNYDTVGEQVENVRLTIESLRTELEQLERRGLDDMQSKMSQVPEDELEPGELSEFIDGFAANSDYEYLVDELVERLQTLSKLAQEVDQQGMN